MHYILVPIILNTPKSFQYKVLKQLSRNLCCNISSTKALDVHKDDMSGVWSITAAHQQGQPIKMF